ncbi:MAG: hypothetical protein KDD56_04280 [Bdellovibrionales bacterium]|nr:hypothetical protein [Bdellovibrionales bacterium]
MNYRRFLIKFFTFIGGIYFFLEFVIPPSVMKFDAYHVKISTYFIAVGAMAVGLGLINLIMVHGSKIIFLKKGWVYSTALLLGLILMLIVTVGDWLSSNKVSTLADKYLMLREFSEIIIKDHEAKNSQVPATEIRITALKNAIKEEIALDRIELSDSKNTELSDLLTTVEAKESKLSIEFSKEKLNSLAQDLASLSKFRREYYGERYQNSTIQKLYTLLFDGLFVSLGSAMFSLLGFYIAAAAYRAFRIKSFESALMMLAALLVMLGQISFGLYLWEGFPDLRLWILKIPNAAAFRAIEFGAQVALLIMAFRMWLSIESETFTNQGSDENR